jgi:UDP-N-acetylmuramate--alanine ligase
MNLFNEYRNVFFIGIGGIGMSALARFFYTTGHCVAGYDRTSGPVTTALEKEGINVIFDESVGEIPDVFKNPVQTLVIYTPAVPAKQHQLEWFNKNGFRILKRSRVLGLITENMKSVCVAGTHGKTTVSTLTAFLFRNSKIGVNAFLGGISKNFRTNFLGDPNSDFVVLEADEFDRSFWQLSPNVALITSMDADHLDVYGTVDDVKAGFWGFADRIRPGGKLLIKSGLPISDGLDSDVKVYTYSMDQEADYRVVNLNENGGKYTFDLQTPNGTLKEFRMGIPGLVNVENAAAAIVLGLLNGITYDELKKALPKFLGIARRFDVIINRPGLVYIDDYAHHPTEIEATLKSVHAAYPGKKITGIFQPHLYSRTRDFAKDFAKALDEALDRIILLPIYPAREVPIQGITSGTIGRFLDREKYLLVAKEELINQLEKLKPEVLITMGAGDIDRLVPKIKDWGEKISS